MTPEDEEFQRISREIKRRSEEDDDIQDYKKPWVGLTDEEIKSIWLSGKDYGDDWLDVQSIARAIEAKLKEKNF